MTVAKLALLVGGIVLGLFVLGQYTLTRMLKGDALTTAEVWMHSVLGAGQRDLSGSLAGTTEKELAQSLQITGIDRVVLDPRVDPSVAVLGRYSVEEVQGSVGPGSWS